MIFGGGNICVIIIFIGNMLLVVEVGENGLFLFVLMFFEFMGIVIDLEGDFLIYCWE